MAPILNLVNFLGGFQPFRQQCVLYSKIKYKPSNKLFPLKMRAFLKNFNIDRTIFWGIFEDSIIATFGCFWLLLPTRSNFYGSKWLVQVSRIAYYMFHVGPAPLGGLLGPNIQLFQK